MKKLLILTSLLIFVLVGCEEIKSEYTIFFNTDGGTAIENVVVLEGELVNEPTQPEKTGYTFLGWYSDSSLNVAYDFSKGVNGNLDLYAKWNPNEYDVTFVPNDGVEGSGSVYTYAYGVEVIELEPTKEGYTFEGWYTDETLTNEYTFGPMDDSDVTLYGKWSIIELTLSFDVGSYDTVTPSDVVFNFGSEATLPIPEVDGYEFTGWYLDEDFETLVDSTMLFIQDVMLYGKFEEISDGYQIAVLTYQLEDEYYLNALIGANNYATTYNKSIMTYVAVEISDDAFLDAVELAVSNGAEVVVLPGFLFEVTAYIAQDLYPEVDFIILDGVPHNSEYTDFVTKTNTASVLFREQEAGFLAGYAAVKDGYRSLGFMGGMAVPAVVKYGIGFVAGAYYAADELDVDIVFNDSSYTYTGEFWASASTQAIAASMYANGTEVIFGVCGGGNTAIIHAAEENDKKVIGVDFDMSDYSDTVITSALKRLDVATYAMLHLHFEGDFDSVEISIMGADYSGIGLPLDSSRFNTFGENDYNTVYDLLSYGNIVVPDNVNDLMIFLDSLNAGGSDNFQEDTIHPN